MWCYSIEVFVIGNKTKIPSCFKGEIELGFLQGNCTAESMNSVSDKSDNFKQSMFYTVWGITHMMIQNKSLILLKIF